MPVPCATTQSVRNTLLCLKHRHNLTQRFKTQWHNLFVSINNRQEHVYLSPFNLQVKPQRKCCCGVNWAPWSWDPALALTHCGWVAQSQTCVPGRGSVWNPSKELPLGSQIITEIWKILFSPFHGCFHFHKTQWHPLYSSWQKSWCC